jgi:hypothetical protein
MTSGQGAGMTEFRERPRQAAEHMVIVLLTDAGGQYHVFANIKPLVMLCR